MRGDHFSLCVYMQENRTQGEMEVAYQPERLSLSETNYSTLLALHSQLPKLEIWKIQFKAMETSIFNHDNVTDLHGEQGHFTFVIASKKYNGMCFERKLAQILLKIHIFGFIYV